MCGSPNTTETILMDSQMYHKGQALIEDCCGQRYRKLSLDLEKLPCLFSQCLYYMPKSQLPQAKLQQLGE